MASPLIKCHVCGAGLKPIATVLPFKETGRAIVILKDLPVQQCENCRESMIRDKITQRAENSPAQAGTTAAQTVTTPILNAVCFAA